MPTRDEANNSLESRTPALRGGLLVETFSSVRGWIESAREGSVETLSLLINGETYWTGLAERLEHPEFDPRKPRRACGIWVALPPASFTGQVVGLTLMANDAVVAFEEADLSRRYHGFIDKIEFGRDGMLIEGWAHDRGRPLDAVKLELRHHGVAIHTVVADKPREDLKRDQIGLGNHAFSEFLRRPADRATGTRDFTVWIAETQIPLSPSDALMEARRNGANGPKLPHVGKEPDCAGVTLAVLKTGSPESLIAAVCDKISDEEVMGWAIDLHAKDEPVVLDLLVNNFVVATTLTDRYRRDLATKYNCAGFVGFHFEIIPQMRLGKVLNIAVMARKTGAIISQGTRTIVPSFTRLLPPVAKHRERVAAVGRPATLTSATRTVSGPPGAAGKPAGKRNQRKTAPSVALIVLNRDGAALLDRHFETFNEHNSYANVEHIVVDHGSSDDTRQIIENWQHRGLRVRLVERSGNYSFSASNNYAARLTDAEFLVFCNNDIFFCRDTLPPFIEAMCEEGVGAAGIKLLDESRTGEDHGPRIVQHLGVFYNTAKYDRIVHPVEARYLPILEPKLAHNFAAPAVTGAFLGIRRPDFLHMGGFCEGYFYGYEDIDLCLKVLLVLQKSIVVVGSTEALHSRGYSRKKTGLWGGAPMLRNSSLLSSRFGLAVRRLIRSGLVHDHAYWTATKPVIAFAVSEANPKTTAGDFYTAYELALELAALGDATIVFLEEKQNWYDVKDVDLLIAMTHNYELSLLERPKQNLVTIGWARNWFADWAKPRDHEFDIMFSSSPKGALAIEAGLGHPQQVLRIATNPDRFHPGPDDRKTIDYVFTGSFWGHARDLIYLLDPAALPFSCELYGAGWEQVPTLAPYARGFVQYDDLAAIYRRARVVIDDANSVTKEWGSVNSRVFDAISAGALVITNSAAASEDGFDGELPSFESREELEALLRRFCGHEGERVACLQKLQTIVAERHSYADRARQLVSTLDVTLQRMFRIAIKVPCPSRAESHLWGDYHFAQSLARELRALGHSVRLDMLDQWNGPNSLRDDAVICLRGLSQYVPRPDQINICWLISHPDATSLAELRSFDRVYVASARHRDWLEEQRLTNVELLLQCVDTRLFRPDRRDEREKEFGVLFVGNSRNVMRQIVSDAIAIGAPLTVIGSGWDALIPPEFILQSSVPHQDLPKIYSSAQVVLNDHWASMAERGFISNRLFDCVAAGAYVISDEVDGISDLFGPLVRQYRTQDDLRRLIDEGMHASPVAGYRPVANAVSEANSFAARAATISEYVRGNFDRLCEERRTEKSAEFHAKPERMDRASVPA